MGLLGAAGRCWARTRQADRPPHTPRSKASAWRARLCARPTSWTKSNRCGPKPRRGAPRRVVVCALVSSRRAETECLSRVLCEKACRLMFGGVSLSAFRMSARLPVGMSTHCRPSLVCACDAETERGATTGGRHQRDGHAARGRRERARAHRC
eukprot:1532269-Rhodomonas_salina.2